MNMYSVSIVESQRALGKSLCVLFNKRLNLSKLPIRTSAGTLTQSLNITQLELYREPHYFKSDSPVHYYSSLGGSPEKLHVSKET